jgi:hypothetical protein
VHSLVVFHDVTSRPAAPPGLSPFSPREGAPLNWRPSAVADAGNGLHPLPTQSQGEGTEYGRHGTIDS